MLLSAVQQIPETSDDLPNWQRTITRRRRKLISGLDCIKVTQCSLYCIPEMNLNLISCSKMEKQEVTTVVKNRLGKITDEKCNELFTVW